MQTTSSGWAANIAKPHRRLGQGLLMDWIRTTNSGVKFFQIGQSKIGGPDIIKGGGAAITFFDKYSYKDYSPYVMSWTVKKTLGQYPYGTIMAQADVELDNSNRIFLPNYDATIGSGILPNRPLKLSIGVEGEFMKQFVGFTGAPDISLKDRKLTLHAYDVFNYLNSLQVTYSGVMQNKYFHEVVSQILTDNGFGSNQFVLDKSLQSPISFIAPNGLKAGDIFAQGVEAEQGLMFSDENGIIRFWNRQHFLTTSGIQTFALSYSSLQDLQYQNTPIINHVVVQANPRTAQANQKVWELSGTIEVPAGSSFTYTVDFSDDDGPLPVASVDVPGYFTTALTSWYATNLSSDGSGAAGNANVYVSGAFSKGSQYLITFRNTYTSSVFITAMAIYATPAKVSTHIIQEYKDQTSIDTFGENPAQNGDPIIIQNDLIQDSSTANTLAYTLVKAYKDPRKRYLCPVAVGSNPAWQIGDAGTLTIRDTGEVKSVWIVGITNVVDRSKSYNQVLEVEERNLTKYFQIGQSSIGGRDAIAP